jgi:hypothetical protein
MTLFEFNKQTNYSLLLVSSLGILSVILPWIEYPRLEMILKGSDGDGVFLSILFTIIFLINAYVWYKGGLRNKKIANMISFIFGAIIFLLAIYKIYAFYVDVYNFASDDPITSYAGAGVNLKSGLYVISFLSFMILLLSSIGIYFTDTKRLVVLIGMLLLSGLLTYFVYNSIKNENRLDKIEIEENLHTYFDKMGNALIQKRSDEFVEYMHPILYQSIGGKKKMAELMTALYQDVDIKDGKLVRVLKTETRGDAIQALLMQSFTFKNAEGESQSNNRSFAFSYDGGKTWSFAGIENRSFDEMKKILPEIFEELRY